MQNSMHQNPADHGSPVSATLKDILTPGVIGVPAGATMAKALERMRKARISSVVALNRGRPVGILTERGVITALAEGGNPLLTLKVRDVMSTPVRTAQADMPIHQAFSLLLREGIRHLVVVDDKGKALGMVTQTNMVQNLGVEYFVEIKRTAQIMVREMATLAVSASLDKALEFMAKGRKSCVVALEEGHAVGILTERDMVAQVAQGRDLAAVSIGEVMSRPVITVTADTPVHQSAALMREKGVRRLVVADADGRAVGLVTQSDIVKGMEARYVEMLREVIREKDQLLRQAVQEAARNSVYLDTILNTTLDTGIAATDGQTIAFVNQAAQDILGARKEETIGFDLMEFHQRMGVSPKRIRRALADVRRGNSVKFQTTFAKSGSDRHIEGRITGIRADEGLPSGYVFMFRDVTERFQAEQTIRHMAYHDALTGLPNRFLVSDRLEQGLAQAKRRGCLLAVMLLDLDGFKTINDRLGHNVGDMLLRVVADRIGAMLRRSDTVGRMGGDEFLAVLPEVKTPEGAGAVASKMLRAVSQPCHVSGHDISIGASIGVALYPWDGDDAQTLIQRADAAMYLAKDAGRGTYRFSRETREGLDFNHP